jgi:8-oxo-dGTP diphosphatase
MSLAGQRLQPDRYSIVPRTLSFLTRPGEVLLMRVPPGRGAWAGRYNGIGGHLERGENPLGSALREIREETGLVVESLLLVGVAVIDTQRSPGIGLYIFRGPGPPGDLSATPEGTAEWVPVARLGEIPLVEDLPALLPHVLGSEDRRPFSASYSYAEDGHLTIRFAE